MFSPRVTVRSGPQLTQMNHMHQSPNLATPWTPTGLDDPTLKIRQQKRREARGYIIQQLRNSYAESI